ncbi:hypothetical protein T4D_16300 [Trichinella pseudospiralis]|uniref:Uncharacterized protein n=1 Tax=Trichinella pseudospiralis TaxID=6337 RepID=A0A0V1FRD7_TRIPS|nr:hypothetical protein T4D_16300 [Trichinella pseudospiralis]
MPCTMLIRKSKYGLFVLIFDCGVVWCSLFLLSCLKFLANSRKNANFKTTFMSLILPGLYIGSFLNSVNSKLLDEIQSKFWDAVGQGIYTDYRLIYKEIGNSRVNLIFAFG